MLALLLAAALSNPADAAAFYFPDTGTKAMGRAGAFTAGADDLSAQLYNPAALIHLDRPQVYFNFSAFHQAVSFTRKDYAADGSIDQTYAEVSNSAAPMMIPALGIGHHFGLPNTYFALGIWTPAAPSLSYPRYGSQHYTLQDSLTWQIWGGPSVAHRFFGWLTVGGGVHWTLVRAEQSLSLMVCLDEDFFNYEVDDCRAESSAEENDLWSEVKAWDKARITGNLGILAEPVPWLSIGASVLPPLNVKARGSLEVQLEEDHWLLEGDGDANGTDPGDENLSALLDGYALDEDVLVKLTMPWVLRTGIAVRPVPELEIEADFVWQSWSKTKEIRVTDVNLVLKDNPENGMLTEDQVITDDVVLPAGYTDSWSIRLGGDYDATDWLAVRAGAFYETTGIPNEVMTVALVDNDKIGISAGGSAIIKDHLAIDLGFIHGFLGTQDVTTSTVPRFEVPVDLGATLGGEPLLIANGEVVANGEYKSSYTMGSLGLTYLWGKRQSEM